MQWRRKSDEEAEMAKENALSKEIAFLFSPMENYNLAIAISPIFCTRTHARTFAPRTQKDTAPMTSRKNRPHGGKIKEVSLLFIYSAPCALGTLCNEPFRK